MRTNRLLSLFIATFALTVVSGSVWTNRIPPAILVLYLVASLVTFLWYAKDKTAAQRNARRTPENTLHLLSLLGGWPGALIAQQKFRHKTIKRSFRLVFWATVVMNCGVFAYLYSSEGAHYLESMIVNLTY